jgi:hypothetical protein
MADLTRRTTLAASAVMPWATALAAAEAGENLEQVGLQLALHRARDHLCVPRACEVGDEGPRCRRHRLLASPAQPYPEDYEEIVAQAARETERRYAPPLAAMVPNIP